MSDGEKYQPGLQEGTLEGQRFTFRDFTEEEEMESYEVWESVERDLLRDRADAYADLVRACRRLTEPMSNNEQELAVQQVKDAVRWYDALPDWC